MKRFVISLAAVLALTACGGSTPSPDGGEDNHRLYHEQIEIDGETVDCVVYDDGSYEQGGVSCDFTDQPLY